MSDNDPEIIFSNHAYQHESIEDLTTDPGKTYSRYVSEVNDRLGYSHDMIKFRQQAIEEWGTHLSHYGKDICHATVFTGGKGEGTALLYESDFDRMHIERDIICADNLQNDIHHENITLFQTERHETSPGYTRLKLIKHSGKSSMQEYLRKSLYKSETGACYLSSLFLTDELQTHLVDGTRYDPATSGPSTSISTEFVKMDIVYSLRCFCPDILERWVSRTRCHGWPSRDTIHEISLLDAHVVPVGFKESANRFSEWRICYSLAELHLMRSLNETQIKVYIILKKICKSVLNPVCEDMTSYIMKNVVLWMCETHGGDSFTPDLLMERLSDCIIYLRYCVNDSNLPNYMIPERNLLKGRLDIQQKQHLFSLLSDLLSDGGRMLLRCDKLCEAMLVMIKIPDMFREFSMKRDMVEWLLMMMISIKCEACPLELSKEEINQVLSQNEHCPHIEFLFRDLMHFDAHSQTLRQMGKTEVEIMYLLATNLTQLLS